jgi:multicomponent Na+:H+ antiporter subunit F
MLVGIAIGFIAVIAIRTSFNLYVDIAIALALVGFLATVAFARFILSRQNDALRKIGQQIEGVDPGLVPNRSKSAASKTGKSQNSTSRKKRGN